MQVFFSLCPFDFFVFSTPCFWSLCPFTPGSGSLPTFPSPRLPACHFFCTDTPRPFCVPNLLVSNISQASDLRFTVYDPYRDQHPNIPCTRFKNNRKKHSLKGKFPLSSNATGIFPILHSWWQPCLWPPRTRPYAYPVSQGWPSIRS